MQEIVRFADLPVGASFTFDPATCWPVYVKRSKLAYVDALDGTEKIARDENMSVCTV